VEWSGTPPQRAVITYRAGRAFGRMRPETVNVPCAEAPVVIAPIPAKAWPASARESTKTFEPREQRPEWPNIRTVPPALTTLGRTCKLGRVCTDRTRVGAVRASVEECRFLATETEALPVMPPDVAVIVPLPTVVALKVVVPAGFGENVPRGGETDQLGV